jgi:hypothetical protein
MSTTTKPKAKSKGKSKKGVQAVADAVAAVTANRMLSAAEELAVAAPTRTAEEIAKELEAVHKKIGNCFYGQNATKLRLEQEAKDLEGELSMLQAMGTEARDACIPKPKLVDLPIDKIEIDGDNPNHPVLY